MYAPGVGGCRNNGKEQAAVKKHLQLLEYQSPFYPLISAHLAWSVPGQE